MEDKNMNNSEEKKVLVDDDGIVIIEDDDNYSEVQYSQNTSNSEEDCEEPLYNSKSDYEQTQTRKENNRGGFRVYTFGMESDNSLWGNVKRILVWIGIIFALMLVFRFLFSAFVFLFPALVIWYLISLFRNMR